MKNNRNGRFPIRCTFFFLLVFAGRTLLAQNSKMPLDKGFIEKTITYYYGKRIKQHPGNNLFLIARDSVNMNAKTDYTSFKVQFVSMDQAAVIAKRGIKKPLEIDMILIKWVNMDTIDVAITRCSFTTKEVTKVVEGKKVVAHEPAIDNCAEASIEIPTCRFIYNQPTSAWSQLDDGKPLKKN